MNAPAFGRNVAPLGREVGCHGICPWGSTYLSSSEGQQKNLETSPEEWLHCLMDKKQWEMGGLWGRGKICHFCMKLVNFEPVNFYTSL